MLTLILLVTILAEICLFANSHLEVNKWLALQLLKLVFAASAFGVYVGCGGHAGPGGGGRGTCTPVPFAWGNWVAVRETVGILVGFW